MKKYWLVIIFVVMLAGAIVPTYLYNERPETVVAKALIKLKDAKSLMAAVTVGTFAPEAIVKAAGADPNLVLLPIVFVGEAGINIPKDAPPSGNATFVIVGHDKSQPEVTFHVVTADDGTSYVEFENVPESKTSAKVVEALNGKWYSMRSRGLAALLARDGEATPGQEDPTGKPAADAWARIRQEVADGEMFGPPVALGAQVLGTVNARRYSLPFKHDELVKLAVDMRTILRGRTLTDDEQKEVARSMEGQEATLELWIDRHAEKIVQMNLDVKAVDAAPATNAPAQPPSHLSVLLRITSWDVPVDVQKPADSAPFEDLIQKLKQK